MQRDGLSALGPWLDKAFSGGLPEGTAGLCFNLYETETGRWAMELVAAGQFDPENEDWPCDELSDLGTRARPLTWDGGDWETALARAETALRAELPDRRGTLERVQGAAVGFVDGGLTLLWP